MERYGYIRVSAKDQNPERQLLAMQEQQIKKGNIYLDKMSGKSFVRPQYLRMLKRVRKGDVVLPFLLIANPVVCNTLTYGYTAIGRPADSSLFYKSQAYEMAQK